MRNLKFLHPLEKEMATDSSILVWKISWTEEPGGLQSMESQRVRHDLVTKPPPKFLHKIPLPLVVYSLNGKYASVIHVTSTWLAAWFLLLAHLTI